MGSIRCVVVAILITTMTVASSVGAAGAKSPLRCPSPTVGQVASEPIPAGAKLVLSIWMAFNHEEDYGNYSFWALDSGASSFTVWKATDGSFYGFQLTVGIWKTYQGALSLGAGLVQPKNGSGPWVEVNYFHFNGTFTPGSLPVKGYVGSFSGGGTIADILNGTYATQAGSSYPSSSFTDPYFNNYTASSGYIDLHDDYAGDYFYLPGGQEYCYAQTLTTFSSVGDLLT
ncbi:MAG TPA: hypothetical protein VN864_01385 [Thermoplasmata archaeon]|nr:hypothetical protein [Thermoplasmata archaeon]